MDMFSDIMSIIIVGIVATAVSITVGLILHHWYWLYSSEEDGDEPQWPMALMPAQWTKFGPDSTESYLPELGVFVQALIKERLYYPPVVVCLSSSEQHHLLDGTTELYAIWQDEFQNYYYKQDQILAWAPLPR